MIHTTPARPYALLGKKGSNLRSSPTNRIRATGSVRSAALEQGRTLCCHAQSSLRLSGNLPIQSAWAGFVWAGKGASPKMKSSPPILAFHLRNPTVESDLCGVDHPTGTNVTRPMAAVHNKERTVLWKLDTTV